MIDFGKLYCDLHPNELITNFCLRESCLVGLCATCICSHTEYHVCNKTSPEYQNIRTTFSSVHETIRSTIAGLDTQKARIDKICEFIHLKRRTLKENIDMAKAEALQKIEAFYERKEKELLREMENEEKKLGLHSEARMESLMNSLTRETSGLITASQELNSQNFLESYQRVNSQTLTNARKLQREVSEELNSNENFETIINSNQDCLETIAQVLDQSLRLSFKTTARCTSLSPEPTLFPLSTQPNHSPAEFTDGVSRFGPMSRSSSSDFIPRKPDHSSQNAGPSYNAPRHSNGNNFSAMSFSQVPDQQSTQSLRRREDEEQITTKSIPLAEEENVNGQNGSFISQINPLKSKDSSPLYSTTQSQIFSQSQTRGRSSQKSSSVEKPSHQLSRNHQSQLIVLENSRTKTSATRSIPQWQHPCVQPGQNFSSVQPCQEWANNATENLKRNYSSSNKNASKGAPMGKGKFVPQLFEMKGEENLLNVSHERGKIRKSGLTLLKPGAISSRSRGTASKE